MGMNGGPPMLLLALGAVVVIALFSMTIAFGVLWGQEKSKNADLAASMPPSQPTSPSNPTTSPPSTTLTECTTEACVTAAYSLYRSMNKNINPCDNFYEYACGNFSRNEPIPSDKTRWGVFDVLRRQLLRDLVASLQVPDVNALPSGAQANSTQKMQRYFHSCMDSDKIAEDSQNLTSLQNHFNEYSFHLEEWPASRPPVSADKDTLRTMIITARKYGNTLGVFPNGYSANISEPSQNIIEFDAGRFTLDRSTLLNDSKTREHQAYVTYMTDIAVLIKKRISPPEDLVDPIPVEAFREFFQDVLRFERRLANLTLAPEDRRNISALQHPHTFKNFTEYFQVKGNPLNIQAETWVEYFKTAWGDAAKDVTVDTVINVAEPNYYAGLTTALEEGTSAPLKYVFFYNYAGWKIIEPFVSRLDDEFRAIQLKFRRALYGTSTETPRAEICVDTLNDQFPNAIGHMYVSEFYDRKKNMELQEMIDYLMNAFREIIRTSDWMQQSTKDEALTKVDKITRRLGFDEYLMDDLRKLNEEHRNFIASNTFLENYASGRRFEVQLEGREFASRNNKTDWISGPAIVNAFYSPSRNSITFPAGILQAPFMGSDYPKYWNFAAIGTVIGHEITHGFDDRGSTRDGDGYYRNWWDPESRANYNQRAQGIINQYSNYSYMGVQLKGANNQGENIADNGGLRESYRGYKEYQRQQLGGAEEARLPGFADKTTDQMFFLSYAQVWCGDYRLAELELQVNRAHSPGRFRVIGPLHNSPEFAAAYNCPVGSYMNPPNKYGVW
ncbi:hypothetical protein RvY_06594 [Ramazzottius varieornatus]|uniref:Uncharacterized protein n=1 Tax=Ramazzottius varieornatus TaxID=947166 RepID=A0A1D1V2J1_RAMVA|nr:hypothetical protein RvY_06594 [Ramazzottius varieornatus]